METLDDMMDEGLISAEQFDRYNAGTAPARVRAHDRIHVHVLRLSLHPKRSDRVVGALHRPVSGFLPS